MARCCTANSSARISAPPRTDRQALSLTRGRPVRRPLSFMVFLQFARALGAIALNRSECAVVAATAVGSLPLLRGRVGEGADFSGAACSVPPPCPSPASGGGNGVAPAFGTRDSAPAISTSTDCALVELDVEPLDDWRKVGLGLAQRGGDLV